MTEVGCNSSQIHEEGIGQFVLHACSDEKERACIAKGRFRVGGRKSFLIVRLVKR